MVDTFYKFVSMAKGETLYLNKSQICSIRQIGMGEGTGIKVTNGDLFLVDHTAEQVLLIFSKQEE